MTFTSGGRKYLSNDRLKRVGIDLDGTLAKAVFDPENPTDDIGEPIWENVRKLLELYDAGYRIYIWTSRPDWQVELIEDWLEQHSIPYRDVRCGKPLFVIYIDDRARHESAESWMP